MTTALDITPAIAELMQVIAAQNEASPSDLRWWDCFCVETDDHHECLNATLEEFAEKLDRMGWTADSVERATAICKACSNREFEPTEEQEREDFEVYEARKI